MRLLAYFFFGGVVFLAACKGNIQEIPVDPAVKIRNREETLIKINNYVAKRNQELIGQFVERTGLKMHETGSGLWVGANTDGKGKPIIPGDLVEITYKLHLLDGTFVDSVSYLNPKVIKSGSGGVEAGLEEALMLLREGDHAYLIIPPHLAYGNFGNSDKIPPGAILFYDLYVKNVKP